MNDETLIDRPPPPGTFEEGREVHRRGRFAVVRRGSWNYVVADVNEKGFRVLVTDLRVSKCVAVVNALAEREEAKKGGAP